MGIQEGEYLVRDALRLKSLPTVSTLLWINQTVLMKAGRSLCLMYPMNLRHQ